MLQDQSFIAIVSLLPFLKSIFCSPRAKVGGNDGKAEFRRGLQWAGWILWRHSTAHIQGSSEIASDIASDPWKCECTSWANIGVTYIEIPGCLCLTLVRFQFLLPFPSTSPSVVSLSICQLPDFRDLLHSRPRNWKYLTSRSDSTLSKDSSCSQYLTETRRIYFTSFSRLKQLATREGILNVPPSERQAVSELSSIQLSYKSLEHYTFFIEQCNQHEII